MTYYKYSLQKYAGMKTKHICPQCGKRSFTLFVDSRGNPIDETVGRCDHESKCGYIRTPKEFFSEHPERKRTSFFDTYIIRREPQRKPDYIPKEYVDKCLSLHSNLGRYLSTIIDTAPGDKPFLERIQDLYKLGCTKNGSTIYWQIDINNHVRTGKIIQYNPMTGHRSHDVGGVNWVHAIMKKKRLLNEGFNLSQCLFGEHLLPYYPNADVMLVESEKTAVLCSCLFPLKVWLATGGKQNFKRELLQVLSGRKVFVFPDTDCYEDWKEKASKMRFARFNVFDIDSIADSNDKKDKTDIGDWAIKQLELNIN